MYIPDQLNTTIAIAEWAENCK